MCLGSVQTLKTSSRGASKTRVRTRVGSLDDVDFFVGMMFSLILNSAAQRHEPSKAWLAQKQGEPDDDPEDNREGGLRITDAQVRRDCAAQPPREEDRAK